MGHRFAVVCLVLVAGCAGDTIVSVDADRTDAGHTDAVDLTRPDTIITAGPPLLTNVAPARFEFIASEPSTFRCRLDGGAEEACTSPRMLVGLADGPHTFEVTAIDSSDLADPTPAARSWRIDTVPPQTAIIDAPPDPDNSRTARFTFEAPGEIGASFECSLDGAVFTGCTTPRVIVDLVDGAHAFRVRARDAAGNLDETPELHEWQVDTLTPDTVIDSGPSGTVTTTTATFTFSAPTASTTATFACRLDAAPFGACVSPRTFAGLAQGAHTFEVAVSDGPGNTDPSPARRTWTIDSVGPTIVITGRPDNPSNDTSPTFTFTASEPQSTFECRIDGSFAYLPCTSPFTPAVAIPPGVRFFRVRATDVLGNRGPEATYEWLIDSGGPAVTITAGPTGVVASSTAVFEWSSSEPATFCYRFGGDAQDTCTVALAGAGTATRAALAEGAQTFSVTATDALGNAGVQVVRNFTVDTVGPAVTIADGPAGAVGSIANVFTFSAAETATFCYQVDGGFEQCTPLPGGLSATVTVNAVDGAHSLAVVARDVLGNRTATAAIRNWTVDTVRPTATITSGPAASSVEGVADATVVVGASDPSTICWRLGAGAPTCSAGAQLSRQIDLTGLAEGPVAFTAWAADAVGAGPPVTRTWTVDLTRPTVAITAGPAAGSTVGSSEASFTVTSTERSRICWTWNGGAESCSPDGVMVFSPARSGLPDGDNTFTVLARDAIGAGAPVTRAWTIDSARPSVTITGGPVAGAIDGESVATFTATSDEAATICWRFDGGAETCSADGVLEASATSDALADGSHVFSVHGRDSVGAGAPAIRGWTVDTVRPTIEITAGPAQGSVSGSTTASFAMSSSEPARICWQIDGGAASCTQPGADTATIAASGLGAGDHVLSVTGADAVASGAATTRAWTVDLTRPAVTITSGPAADELIHASSTVFTATTVEPATICWQLDGDPPQCSAAGVMQADIQLAALAEGPHALAVHASDEVGAGAVTSTRFSVDTIRPVVSVTDGPAEASSIGASRATFAVVASEASTICWRFDGEAFTCSAPGASSAVAVGDPLPDGAHTFEARAADSGGDGASATVHFTVDTQRPTATIDAGVAQDSITGATVATFTVGADEPARFCWRFNSDDVTCSGPGLVTLDITSHVLAPGGNVFSVYAVDAVGDGMVVNRGWVIDDVRPTLTIDSGPGEGELLGVGSASFELSASEGSTICWSVNGVPVLPCTPPGRLQATAAVSGLLEGTNTFSATAADDVGAGLAIERHFTVDTVAPAVSITSGPAAGSVGNATAASFDLASDEPATICWTLDGGGPTCSAPGAMSATAPLAGLAEGEHTLAVTATDAAHHAGSVARAWTVDLTAPTVTLGPPAEGAFSNDVAPTIAITASEPSTICWTLDDVGPPTCSTPLAAGVDAVLAALAEGPHTLAAVATDRAGNVGPETLRHWTVDVTAPTVTIGPPEEGSTSGEVSPTITIATDEPSMICWMLDGDLIATCSAAGAESFDAVLAALAEGPHELVVMATDRAGNDSGLVIRQWTVALPPPPP